jgi:hypothetical protein
MSFREEADALRRSEALPRHFRPVSVSRDDDALLRALRQGDERVFGELVEGWSGMMLRLALSHVESRAIAEAGGVADPSCNAGRIYGTMAKAQARRYRYGCSDPLNDCLSADCSSRTRLEGFLP